MLMDLIYLNIFLIKLYHFLNLMIIKELFLIKKIFILL